ncbi:Death-associated inhibitor of apoptosis 1 [Folsomia candida]|uniref:Death-associated inhibitor of apoptosis 1 n=1 Tax=Folsomia candida TaxID=158441 RepID=A0A226DUC0_FOLCA|nr:Death-associated inhibitor of apoptosis 1 [Folsomia candida]
MDSTEAVDMDSEDQPIVTDPQHNLLFPLTINRYEAISHPDMILLPSRLKSFEGKISKAKQTPQQLAEAGFYCDIDGGCICYYCGIGIYKWKPEDDPWVEHALLASHCGFLNLWKSVFESFVKSNAFKDSPFGPVHFLVDRVVIRNNLGQIEIEKEKVLHLALNLLAIARDTPTLQDHLGYFVSECQSLVEDHNNFKIKKGVYANKPDLPQQYCPKSFLFSKWGEVSKYQQNVSPPISKEEKKIKHKFIAARLLVIGDIAGYREHRGCPSTICTEDVAGRVCDVCYHMPEAHSAWEEPARMPEA